MNIPYHIIGFLFDMGFVIGLVQEYLFGPIENVVQNLLHHTIPYHIIGIVFDKHIKRKTSTLGTPGEIGINMQ